MPIRYSTWFIAQFHFFIKTFRKLRKYISYDIAYFTPVSCSTFAVYNSWTNYRKKRSVEWKKKKKRTRKDDIHPKKKFFLLLLFQSNFLDTGLEREFYEFRFRNCITFILETCNMLILFKVVSSRMLAICCNF